jgi:hypothetical protein
VLFHILNCYAEISIFSVILSVVTFRIAFLAVMLNIVTLSVMAPGL